MCFYVTYLYYPVQMDTTHTHLCSGDVSCSGQSMARGWRGNKQKCPLFPTTIQPICYKKPTETKARKAREIISLPIWLLGDFAGTDFCRQHGGRGVKKWKGRAQYVSSFSREAEWQVLPSRWHTQTAEHIKSYRLFFTHVQPLARGILTPKDCLGLVLSFLALCQGGPTQRTFSR